MEDRDYVPTAPAPKLHGFLEIRLMGTFARIPGLEPRRRNGALVIYEALADIRKIPLRGRDAERVATAVEVAERALRTFESRVKSDSVARFEHSEHQPFNDAWVAAKKFMRDLELELR